MYLFITDRSSTSGKLQSPPYVLPSVCFNSNF